MRKTTGISLILLIFLSLCLMTFSLLSLSGATADERLSQKAANRTTEYYAAVNAANEILADIDAALADYLTEAASDESHSTNTDTIASSASADATEAPAQTRWFELCAQLPGKINSSNYPQLLETVSYFSYSESNKSGNETNSDTNFDSEDEQAPAHTLSFDIAVTENQQLHIVLKLHYPEVDSDTMYDIIEWKIENTQDWTADQSQNLFRTDSDILLQN